MWYINRGCSSSSCTTCGPLAADVVYQPRVLFLVLYYVRASRSGCGISTEGVLPRPVLREGLSQLMWYINRATRYREYDSKSLNLHLRSSRHFPASTKVPLLALRNAATCYVLSGESTGLRPSSCGLRAQGQDSASCLHRVLC